MICFLLFLAVASPVSQPVDDSRQRAITAEAEAAAIAPPIDPRARQTLDRILAQRGFSTLRARSWQRDIRQRLSQWFANLWERTIGRRIAGRTLAQAAAWAAALAALVTLVAWLVRLASRSRRERPITVGPMTAPPLPGHILGSHAASLLRAGEIREGARLAYRAVLRRLEEEGALRNDEARTPRENLSLLPDAHRRRGALAAMTTTFERVWYASRVPTQDDTERILSILRDVECLQPDRAR